MFYEYVRVPKIRGEKGRCGCKGMLLLHASKYDKGSGGFEGSAEKEVDVGGDCYG